MHPENEKTQIRTAILKLSPNLHQRRYPNPLREQFVAHTDAVLSRGGTYTEVERDLGISSDTLRRFRRARHEGRNPSSLSALKTVRNFLPVKLAKQESAPIQNRERKPFRVLGPCGIEIDFAQRQTVNGLESTPDWELISNAPETVRWALLGLGPDLVPSNLANPYPTCDPTYGTVSRGKLYLTGPGIGPDKPRVH